MKDAGTYKGERIITSPQLAEINANGKTVLNFCANNYLGLSNDARLKQAALDYEQILLVALSEVDTALGDINHLRQSAAQADRATDAARTALAQSRRLFDAGEIGYLDVLFAEQSLIEADRTLLATKREAALAWARYMTALAIN